MLGNDGGDDDKDSAMTKAVERRCTVVPIESKGDNFRDRRGIKVRYEPCLLLHEYKNRFLCAYAPNCPDEGYAEVLVGVRYGARRRAEEKSVVDDRLHHNHAEHVCVLLSGVLGHLVRKKKKGKKKGVVDDEDI